MKNLLFSAIIICTCSCSHNSDPVKNENWVGTVVEKNRDWDNHGAPYITISLKDVVLDKIELMMWEDCVDMWSYIAVGDSFIKPQGELNVVVKKPSGVWKRFEYPKEMGVISFQ